jgi:hypothetical protein
MKPYHKIPTVFVRDPETKYKTLIHGKFATKELALLREIEWEFTEKIDGTNIRAMWSEGQLTFGGRTDNAQLQASLIVALNNLFQPHRDKLTEMFGDAPVCFYGEGYGPKIQKGGGNYRKDQGFILFDVMVGSIFLERHNVEDIATKLGLDVVPIVDLGNLEDLVRLIQDGLTSTFGDFPAEGLVARPRVPLFDRQGKRIITKLKGKDYR